MGSHMTFVVESFQSAPDTGPFIFDELWFCYGGVRGGVHGGIGIDPLFHFYRAGTVVNFVGYICCLSGYVADLADKGNLANKAQEIVIEIIGSIQDVLV